MEMQQWSPSWTSWPPASQNVYWGSNQGQGWQSSPTPSYSSSSGGWGQDEAALLAQMEQEVNYGDWTFNPVLWAWTFETEDGATVQEVPVWWQEWYTGAYWSQDTGEFPCEEAENQVWWFWQEANEEQAKEVLAVFPFDEDEPEEEVEHAGEGVFDEREELGDALEGPQQHGEDRRGGDEGVVR